MTTDPRTAFPAPATETPPRSCDRIFTCGDTQIVTSPFVDRGAAVFMPEKLGNLQGFWEVEVLGRGLRCECAVVPKRRLEGGFPS